MMLANMAIMKMKTRFVEEDTTTDSAKSGTKKKKSKKKRRPNFDEQDGWEDW